jgi:hypothetical protein
LGSEAEPKVGMSCQDTDNERDSVEILRRDHVRVDTGREAGEKQKLS